VSECGWREIPTHHRSIELVDLYALSNSRSTIICIRPITFVHQRSSSGIVSVSVSHMGPGSSVSVVSVIPGMVSWESPGTARSTAAQEG
jgi:hypothetical protein